MTVDNLIFIIPTLAGMCLGLFSVLIFKRSETSPRYFGVALLVSFLLILSFPIFTVIGTFRDLFGVVYTFVFLFGIAIVGNTVLLVYMLVVIGGIKKDSSELWQEIALLKSQIDQDESTDD